MTAEKTEETTDKATPKGQQRLPGMTPKRIAELVDLGEEVLDLQEKRMHYADLEGKKRDELKGAMKKHKLKEYPISDEYQVVIEAVDEKAFVRKIRSRKPKKITVKDD